MDVRERIKEKARQKNRSIVFPESEDIRILQAAQMLSQEKIAHPILLGESNSLTEVARTYGVDLSGVRILNAKDEEFLDALSKAHSDLSGLSEGATRRLLREPLYFAACMVKLGQADTMVAGLRYTTGEVVLAGQVMIGMEPGIETPSSLFLLRIPGFDGSEGEYLVFADGGVCPDPTSEELADIAVATSRTVRNLLDWEPRIAMISFSTKGSAVHQKVDHVVAALSLVKANHPDILIDGEFQVDAAIVPEIATKKVSEASEVAGRANILIFPDLNSGNAAYKLAQRLARADAYGPFLQGFGKSISDLSRGSTVEDIVGVATMTVARS